MNDKIRYEVETEFTVSGQHSTEQAYDNMIRMSDQYRRAGVFTEKQNEKNTSSLWRQSQALNKTASSSDTLSRATRETARHAGDVDEGFRQVNNTVGRSSEGFISLRYALYDVATTAGVMSAAITAAGTATVIAFASQESAFTEVQRIVGGTTDEVSELRDELMAMSTEIPKSFQELSQIASLGGALGIDASALDEFTSTVAKFATLTGVTEEAATTGFGRISQYLRLTEKDYDNLGSAIVRAGNISVATEEQVLKFSSAIALPAARAGLLTDEVVALGAATASFANINVEGAGSAFSRIFANIERAVVEGGESLDNFGAAAGMSADQFKTAWGSDSGGTFNKIIQGLSTDVTGLVGNLDTLGIRNERDRRVVSALALNYGEYARIVGETTNAWREGIYMNEAYGLVLDDLSSKWTIFQNALTNAAAAIGAEVAPSIKGLLDVSTTLLVNLAEFANTPVGEVLIRIVGTVATAAAAFGGLISVVALAGASSLAFRFALQQIAATGIGQALVGLAGAFRGVGTGASAGAYGIRLFNAALKTLGRITVVGALLYAVSELLFNTRESLIWVGDAFIWIADTVVNAMAQVNGVLGFAAATSTKTFKDLGQSIKKWGETFPKTSDDISGAGSSMSDFNDILNQTEEEIPDLSGLGGGLDDVGSAADTAAEKIYTLVDYANDLSSVWKRAFDIRFSGQQTFDDIENSLQKMRDAAADSAKKVRDLQLNVRSLTADISGLKSDIGILEYYLKIAREYGDTKRATALEAELAKKRAELAEKTADLSDKSKELKTEQDSQSKSLTGGTAAARANRAEILALVQQYQAHIQKLAESGMSQEQLAIETEKLRQDFIKQATQLGFNRRELERYAQGFNDVQVAISRVPRNITVNANANPALQALAEFAARAQTQMSNAGSAAKNAFNNAISGIGSNIPATVPAPKSNIANAFPYPYSSWGTFMAAMRKAGFPYARLPGDFNSLAWIGSSLGYAEGGYTGSGGKYDVAGAVHRGEYVIPKRDVNQSTGMPRADALGRLMGGVRGYANGGPTVGATSSNSGVVSLSAGSIQALAQAVQPYLVLDGKIIADASSDVYAQQTTVGAY